MRAVWILAAAVVLGGLTLLAERSAHTTGVSDPSISSTDTHQLPNNAMTSEDVYYKTEGIVSGPPAPSSERNEYPALNLPSPFNDTRLIIWFLGQQHLYFGSFVLGVLFLVMIFELIGLIARTKDTAQRYDSLALKMLGVIILAFSLTAITGGLLLFGLLTLYPHVITYLAGVFRPFFLIYGLLFLALTLIVYFHYYSWQRMTVGFSKWIHATVGVLINAIGTAIMFLANSWGTFMMSPAGIDARGRFLGNYWNVLHNALWKSFNVHRFFGNIIFGAAVMAAYAAYHALNAKDKDERAYYDWMGYVSFLMMVFTLFTVPFGGYWLVNEVNSFDQQMWITITGGLLAWLLYVLFFLIGLLFATINYYVWQQIDSNDGGKRYRSYAKYVFFILVVCILVIATPHTLVMKPLELKAIGGQQHPVIGNFGVESSKKTAVNIMMVITIGSLLLLWRSRYRSALLTQTMADVALGGLFGAGIANIVWLGIYGYYVPANVHVGLSVPMMLSTASIIIFGSILTFATFVRSKPVSSPGLGRLSARGNFALLSIAITITWIMGVGGYMRSALRLFWHVSKIMRDTSPWAFTHRIGFAANMITLNALLFWGTLLFLFWLQKRRDTIIKNTR
jgi:cytochrome bd-type quinol oxidase subunit 1